MRTNNTPASADPVVTNNSTIAPATIPPTTTTRSSTSTANASSVLSVKASGSSARLSSRSAQSSSSSASPRVVYGRGTISRLSAELGQLQVTSLLIVSSPSRVGLARRIQTLIPNLDSHILDSAVVNVSSRVVDDTVARISGRDAVVSVGGGSAVGLARAISIKKGIPHICIPTAYSGSEMTLLVGDPKLDPKSVTFRDSNVLPTVVIYDEDLTASSPRRFSVPSSAPEYSCSPKDDTAQWSYIHLPGV